MRNFDWRHSPAGAIDDWPEPLQHAARLMLLSTAAMTILIGREGLLIYNDATRTMFGNDYDGALGQPVGAVLPEAADFYRAAIDECYDRRSGIRFADAPIKLRRNGTLATAWFDLAFTPIANAEGDVFGVLLIANETTDRIKALRDLQRARERMDIALDAGGIVGTWDLDVATNRLTSDDRFARLFGVSPEEARVGIDNEILVNVVHPEDRQQVVAALDRAIQSGADYRCRYRAITPDGGVRWYVDAGRAVPGADGKTAKLCGVVIDLTDQVATANALAESEMRFDALAESIPHIVWSTDAEGLHDYFNRHWNEFTGLDGLTASPDTWTRLVHADDWERVSGTWAQCLATGQPYDIEYRFLYHSGAYRWLKVMALPLRDRHGQITRWYGTATDIDDAKHLETERELVANELDHRIKNLFALVNGLVALSVRDEPQMAPLAAVLQHRLGALHTAHGFLRSTSAKTDVLGATLQALVRTLLKPYDDGGTRILIVGDDAAMSQDMVTPLALVFHELATNSAKYGALANPQGIIHLTFTRGNAQMRIDWQESGLAISRPPEDSGFGSRLLTLTIERQLRGAFSRIWEPTGMAFHLTIPLGV
ncbi:PAS domain-containing protein [Hephaestia sp. GCM10023244]|uniref:PAS domain-containing protein n=1 Tax=unclassified Hephaestia TaxID=2631281 RepID=UPI002076DCFA|nr:PAS domain-containing protein [Hephaestia sp. MAHUQ-44]MCM8729761.1 PAS domain-containing protein [Hephaestia sp. MAHUQ-44]